MSDEYQDPTSSDSGGFGGFTQPVPEFKTADSVWPSSTLWDTFDQKQGIDMTGGGSSAPFQPWGTSSAEEPSNDFRVSNFGAEFVAPSKAEDPAGAQGNLLLPFGEGPVNPRTQYDFWNPAQAIDTLATWARAFVPGVNEAGDTLGHLGQGIADSDFGKWISSSPLAAAGSFVGDAALGVVKGAGQTIGDMFNSWPDVQKSWESGDAAGVLLGMAKMGAGNLIGTTNDRFQGLLHGDQQAIDQLTDEFSFIATVATLGLGAETGVLAKGGSMLAKQGSKVGLTQLAKEGASEYTLSPILNNIATATKFGLAGGYGLELGSEIGSHIFPDWENTNKFIASQTLVPNSSPFRGAFDLAAGSLVDPMPMLGKLAEIPGVRKLMDSDLLQLPSAVQRAAAFMPDGITGVKDVKRFTQEISAALVQDIAARDLQGIGEHGLADKGRRIVLSSSDIAKHADELTQTLTGSGVRKFMGLSSDYTHLQAEMTSTLQKWIKEMEDHFPEYQTKRMSMADFQSRWEETKANWDKIDSAMAPKSNPMLMVRSSTLTDKDFKNAMDFLSSHPDWVAKGGEKGARKVVDGLATEFKQKFPEVLDYMNTGGRNVLTRQQKNLWGDLERHMDMVPKEPAHGPMGKVAEQIRGNGNYKVIQQGTTKALDGDAVFTRHHPAAKEAEIILGKTFEDGKPLTLQALHEMYEKAGFNDAARLLAKWQFDQTSLFSASKGVWKGVLRPVLKPPLELADKMPTGAGRFGNIVSGFREFVPNAELGRKMQEKFFDVHSSELGVTRAKIDEYIDAMRKEADKAKVSHVGQYGAGPMPNTAGRPLQDLAAEIFGADKVRGHNMAQLLEKSMPTENLGQFVKILTGRAHGEVGVAPSFFAGLRASRSGRFGDLYRWWAQVGHPMIRYDVSPLFLAQMPFESKIWNYLRGASHASYDGILAHAANDAVDTVAKKFAGKTMGEQRNIGMFPGDAGASERVAGRSGADAKNLQQQAEFMAKQVIEEVPEKFAERMKMIMPEDYKLLRKSFDSNKEMVEAILNDKQIKEDWFKGKITTEQARSMAKIPINAKGGATFDQLADQLKNAMRDSVRQAQTTHISNPMRKYWEKSFSHPVLMYPLSWTLKAVGEWSRFLTHSAFGLHTGLGGLQTWNHIRDDTMRVLTADPDAMDWIEKHPETIKIMEYLMPGLPSSPIPGDDAGVGFGLMSVPLRNGVQLGWNLAHGQPADSNMSDMSKIGFFRDMKALPKLWSEWVLGKPETTIDNPGLTVGKTKHTSGFDKYINDQFDLSRR